jgi:hypothetical protein
MINHVHPQYDNAIFIFLYSVQWLAIDIYSESNRRAMHATRHHGIAPTPTTLKAEEHSGSCLNVHPGDA